MTKRKRKFFIIPIIIVAILFIAFMIPNLQNQSKNTFEELGESDRTVLTELNDYMKSEQKESFWEGFELLKQPILAINKDSGQAFLVNSKENVKSFFAKEIVLPEDFTIKAYRVSPTCPQMFRFLFSGNFNTIDNTYSVLGNDVYFTKYDEKSLVGENNSLHFIALLSHESFHNIMQSNWPDVGRFQTESLTDKDLELLDAEYIVLDKIYEALKQSDTAKLKDLAKEYVSAVEKRVAQNPQYMQDELQAETCEGTATYVEMLASKAAGYPNQIMNFDASSKGLGTIEWHFDTVVPMIKSGELTTDKISSYLVYQSGGLLCRMMDSLGIPDWQSKLNGQTKESPVTLYSIIADYVNQ